jgi:hypothetical protein
MDDAKNHILPLTGIEPHSLEFPAIQSAPGGEVNILGGHSIFKGKNLKEKYL